MWSVNRRDPVELFIIKFLFQLRAQLSKQFKLCLFHSRTKHRAQILSDFTKKRKNYTQFDIDIIHYKNMKFHSNRSILTHSSKRWIRWSQKKKLRFIRPNDLILLINANYYPSDDSTIIENCMVFFYHICN